MKAQVYLEFDRRDQAEKAALRALKIEPNFVSALFFLRDKFGYFKNTESFNKKIMLIGQIAIRHPYPAGSYLDNLFKIPEAHR
jgi:hypothetical protein